MHEYISTAEVELAVVPPSQTSLPRASQCATSTEHTPERRTRPAAARGLDPELTGGVDHSIVVGDDLGEVAAELLCGWRRGSRRATAGPACCAGTRPRTSSPPMPRHGGSAGRAIASSTLTDITDTLVTRPASAPRNAAMGLLSVSPSSTTTAGHRACSTRLAQSSALMAASVHGPAAQGKGPVWFCPNSDSRTRVAGRSASHGRATDVCPQTLPRQLQGSYRGAYSYKRLLGDRHPRHAALRSTGRRARTSAPKDALGCRADATERHTCGVLCRQGVVVRSGEAGPGRRPGGRARRSRRRRMSTTPAFGNLVGSRRAAISDRVEEHGQPGFGSSSLRGAGSPRCRVPGHTFVTPQVGVSMKPCGHDHDELNHLSRPHQVVGHAVPELRGGRARHHAASAVARQRISPSRRP